MDEAARMLERMCADLGAVDDETINKDYGHYIMPPAQSVRAMSNRQRRILALDVQ
jgi:hypothetical protein